MDWTFENLGPERWHMDSQGNKIHDTAIIGDNVVLGSGNLIYPFAVIGTKGFIRGGEESEGQIIIGNNNWIGNNVSIMAGREITRIGNDNMLMNYVNVGHDVHIGDWNEIGVRCTLSGHSAIGDGNKIKIDVTIRNRKIIGHRNIIGMGSVVIDDFPLNDQLIHGHPAKIIKRL